MATIRHKSYENYMWQPQTSYHAPFESSLRYGFIFGKVLPLATSDQDPTGQSPKSIIMQGNFQETENSNCNLYIQEAVTHVYHERNKGLECQITIRYPCVHARVGPVPKQIGNSYDNFDLHLKFSPIPKFLCMIFLLAHNINIEKRKLIIRSLLSHWPFIL